MDKEAILNALQDALANAEDVRIGFNEDGVAYRMLSEAIALILKEAIE